MIPYIEIRTFVFGPIALPSFLTLVVTAVCVAVVIIVLRGKRFGVPYERSEEMCLWAVLAGVLGAKLFRFAYDRPAFEEVLAHPQLILAGGITSFGGFFGGMLGIAAFFRVRRVDRATRMRLLDVGAFAMPFSWIFGRVGCALVHDHPGLRTGSWLGVRFPGGTRFDLGVLEVFFLLLLGVAFLLLDRKPRRAGFFFACFFIVYGLFRILLDQAHVDPPRYFGIAVDQYAGAAAACLGAFAWRLVRRSQSPLQ